MSAGEAIPDLSLEDVSAAALLIAAGGGLEERAERLLSILRAWASPSSVLCLARDEAAEGGFRLRPELSAGHAAPGQERWLARLLEEADPASLQAPRLVRPSQDFAGLHVKPRDSWLVPWSGRGTSGFLLLRGVASPSPSNLGAAVALASQSLWPLLPAAAPVEAEPAAERLARLERLSHEVQALAEGLGREVRAERGRAQAMEEAASAAASAEAERDDAQRRLAALQEQLGALEQARAVAEAERERLAARQAGFEEAQRQVTALQERLKALEQEKDTTRSEATAAASADSPDISGTKGEIESQLQDLREALGFERLRADSEHQAAESARQGAKAAELLLAQQAQETDQLRRRRNELQDALDASEKARAAVEEERDRAKAEVNPLWATIESLRRQLQGEQQKAAEESASAAEARRAREEAEHERDAAREQAAAEQAAASAARAGAQQAERQAQALGERWDRTVGALRGALQALRRTPFVPPTLSVSFAAAESALEAVEGASARRPPGAGLRPLRLLFLDRDVPSLETLAGELEAEGVDVQIAHYPEEVSFFLKTPSARHLTALVGDAMAFRGEQEMLEAYRTWRLELRGLALLVSHRAADPAEAERVRHLPAALAVEHVDRPVTRVALMEAVAGAARRAQRPADAAGVPPRR